MIQNYIPQTMRLNKLSKVAEETLLPRSVNLPPLGGESFNINESDMTFVEKLHSDYLAEVSRSNMRETQPPAEASPRAGDE